MKNKIEVGIEFKNKEITLVANKQLISRNKGDASFIDLTIANKTLLKANKVTLVDLGVKIKIPDGYYVRLKGRSSTSTKFNVLVNEGTIDNGYRNELKAQFVNFTNKDIILNNDRCYIQLILCPLIENIEVKNVVVKSNTERGLGGFGSTTKKIK